MSIISMTLTKRWLLGIGLVCLLGVGIIVFSRADLSRDSSALPGLRALIDEKTPESALLKWYRNLISRQKVSQTSAATVGFTIRSQLFSSETITGDYLLSGNIDLTVMTLYDTDERIGTLSGETRIRVGGIKEQDEEVEEELMDSENTLVATTTNGFDIYVIWTAKVYNNEIYLYLDEVTFSTEKEGGLTTIRQRYLLINQYKQRWVRFSREEIKWFSLFLPDFLVNVINNNDQKIRIVPDQNEGWLYLLSGESLYLSGHAGNTDGDKLTALLPQNNIRIDFDESHVPGIINVTAFQDTAYQGTFEGTAQLEHTFRKHSMTLQGEATWPRGIQGNVNYSLLQKRGNLSPSDITLPDQYLERSTIYSNWKQVGTK